MADDYTVPGGAGDVNEFTRRAQAAERNADRMREKDEQRRRSAEDTSRVERDSTRTRGELSRAAENLSTNIEASASAFARENEVLTANVRLLEQQLALRRSLASTPGVGRMARARAEGSMAAAPVIPAGAVEDPNAQRRLDDAIRRQAQVEARATQASGLYTASLRPGAATSGQSPELLAQRDELRARAALSRQETAAARESLQAQDAIVAARRAEQAQLARQNEAIAAETRAAVAAADAEKARAAEIAVAAPGRLALPPGRTPSPVTYGGWGTSLAYSGVPGPGGVPVGERSYPLVTGMGGEGYMGASRSSLGLWGNEQRGIVGRVGQGAVSAETAQRMEAYRVTTARALSNVEQLEAGQVAANRAFQEAGVVYSNASLALSRHGALTTEFIQAFARGQVTLKEFESQMVSTIGKFGGWLVAGAAVYTVFEAFKHVTEGVIQTQAAVQQLGRFLPGLGGPMGGGTGQIPAAESAVRNISQEFNVPIRDVVEPMQVMARTFHDVNNAAAATRAVLAVQRLDLVPGEQAERFLTGISNSLGFSGQRGGGEALVHVVNSLNALQATLGARVSETLPAVARAAPLAQTMGLETNDLMALAAMGVRGGVTGPQIGTALFRSMANFAFRESSLQEYQNVGLGDIQQGQYGLLMSRAMRGIDEGTIRPNQLRDLSVAIAGPQQARSIMPMLIQEMQNPGTYARAQHQAGTPRDYQEDLARLTGTVSERFKSLGITLENFGSRLYSAGITAPVNLLIDGISVATRGFTSLARPISSVLDVFNQLPAVVRDAVGAFIAWQVGTRLYQSQFGATTRGFLSRLPTPFDISNRPADVAGGYADRLQRDLIPVAQREFDRASTQALSAGLAQQRLGARRDELAGLTPMMMGRAETDPERMRWARQLDQVSGREMAARATLAAAAEESAMAEQGLLRLQADYQLMKDKSLTFAERASIAEQRGTIATDATAATQEAIEVIKAEQLAASRGELAATRMATAAAGGGGLWLPPGVGRGGGAGPAAAAAEMATAEAGFLTTRLRRLGSRMIESQDFPLAWPGVQALRLANTGAVAGAEGGLSRLAGFGNTLGAGMMAGIPGALGTAFQGIFAAQMLNAVAPGRVGDTIGQIGTAGALGAGGVQLARSVAERFGYRGTIGMGAGIGTAIGVDLMQRQDVPSQVLGGGLAFGLGARMLGASGPLGLAIGGTAAVGQGLQAWANSQNTGLATRAEEGYGAPRVPEYGPLGFMRTQGDRNLWEWINPLHRPSVEVHQTQQAVARWRQNQANLRTAQQGGALSMGGIDQFGSSVSQAMDDAFNATGDTQKQAQAFLTSHMRSLSTSLQAFGGTSAAGRNSARLLQETVNQAMQREAADPATADQVQQLATQATQAITQSAQQDYQLAMVRARNATDRQAAYQQLLAAERQNIANEYTNALPQLRSDLAGQETRYNDLLRQRNAAPEGSDRRRSLTARVNAAGDVITTYHNEIDLRLAGAANQRAQDAVTDQQNQARLYSDNQTGIQAQGSVATAMAGANRMAQSRAQIATLRAQIYNAQHNLTLSPEQQTNEIAGFNAQIQTIQQQTMVQQTLTERQARQGVTEARIPTYDTVGQARQRLKDLTDNYNYMKAHPQAYDPADVAQALTAVITAKQGVTDAVAQYATQMGDIRAQLAEAQHIGDNVAQATDELNAAYNQLANARGPQAQAQARQRVLTAQNQRYSAVTSRQDAQYQLAQVNATGDAAAQAHIQMAQASYDLSRARGPDERTAALQERAQAQVAEHQATQQQIAAYGQYRQALAQGDPMAQARIGVQTAQAILANARGVDEITAAQTQVAQAFWTQHEAYMASIQAQTDLAASRTREPMQQLQIQLRGAQRQLASARGPEERTRDQTQVNSLRNQITGQHISERESTVDFMLSMGQITTQQAVRMWEDIARTRGITKAERQQVLQRIHQAQMGDETQFDVGPTGANIKLPSVTDVMRSMRGAFTNAMHPAHVGMSDTSSTTVNVYVNDSADVPKVADALERATRAKLKSRMRAAGVRGI